MIPGVNPRQMQRMMKQMGMSQEELNASEVIIKLPDRQLVFTNPSVSKVDMMGQETYQIAGTPEEMSLEDGDVEITESDVQTVIDQTGKSRDEVIEAIEEANGDLAEAIMKLSE